MRSRFALLAALALLLGLAGPLSATTAQAANPSWTPPLSLSGGGAEPSIRIPADGRSAAYVSAPTGLGSNFWYIDEIVNPDGSHAFKPSPPRQPDAGTGGGDSEISVSPVVDPATGCAPIAYSGLHNIDLLDNFTTAASNDCGRSFSAPNLFATQNTLTDRQWQTFDGAKTNILLYHKVDTSQIVVARSFDAGKTYTSVSPEGVRGTEDANTFPIVAADNQVGNLVVDAAEPVAGATYPNGDQIHALYATFVGPRSANDNVSRETPGSSNHEDTVYLARSIDGGVTWTDSVVFSADPTTPDRELNNLFPVVAADSAGTLYEVWSDTFKVEYAFSSDHGATWSKPLQVNPDNLGATPDATAADVMPWIAAGDDGKIDIAWYHGQGGATGSNLVHRDPGDAATTWTVGFTQLFNAAIQTSTGTPSPTVMSQSNDIVGPIHHGDICLNGTLCGITSAGDRTLLDFFQVAMDAQGRANLAYASDAGSHGSSVVMFTRQNDGFAATTGSAIQSLNVVPQATISGTSCPGPQVTDPYGDAPGTLLVDNGANNNDQYDIGAVRFETPNASQIKITMTIKDLKSIPEPVTASAMYTVYWQYAGSTYYVQATLNAPGVAFFDVGTYTSNFHSSGTPQGQVTEGADGTIVWTVNRSLVGNPADGSSLASPYGDSRGAFTVTNRGLRYTAAVDRAPDVGSGSDYTLAGAC